jgi:hypothetical protein
VESIACDLQVFPLKIRLRHYPLSTLNYYLALAGLWEMGEFLIRRLCFASPPVMQFTPLAGLRAKNKNSTDILQNILTVSVKYYKTCVVGLFLISIQQQFYCLLSVYHPL